MTRALGLTLLFIALGAVLEWGLGVHHVPGGPALIGAVGCVAIVVVSKALGKWWLQRPELSDE
jgi:hypothetical protein